MIPQAERSAVLEALDDFDKHERGDDRWLENGAQKFALIHEGRLYPPKRVISLATGAPVSAFSGGDESNSWLRDLGFQVQRIGEDDVVRERLAEVFELYGAEDREPFGKDAAAYRAVSAAGDALKDIGAVKDRAGLRVKSSAGTGNWANIPWIALMDQAETTSTQHGVYVVYLFREDMSGVYLTFNQGVTQLFSDHGASEARRKLTAQANEARKFAQHLLSRNFELNNTSIDLRTGAGLGKRYEESTIAHKFYPRDQLPTDDELIDDIEAVLQAYDSYLEDASRQEGGGRGERAPQARETRETPEAARLERALDWIVGQGYHFEPWQLATFVAAARTKPFVILAGVSGTGKSKLPQFLAAATGAQSMTIPVRPDWTDSADLLGFQDLHGRFQPGQLLRFCLDLATTDGRQGICVIDEMNLARVEYYFAEVLSRIEDDATITGQQPLVPQELALEDRAWSEVPLPPNLLIVGTVNMDESTHGFSRKVLDRAFTIEFSRVTLSEWQPAEISTREPEAWDPTDWQPRARRLSQLSELTSVERAMISETVDTLEEANETLQRAQLQVGYRVRDELALFRLHAGPLTEMMVDAEGSKVDPLDVGLSMKLLPRISGGSNLVRRLLQELLAWASDGSSGITEDRADEIVTDWLSAGAGEVLPDARFPRTAARLCLMWQRLQSEGFTSYWL